LHNNYTSSFFILWIAFHIACLQTKCSRVARTTVRMSIPALERTAVRLGTATEANHVINATKVPTQHHLSQGPQHTVLPNVNLRHTSQMKHKL